jgi:hypothetical protein
MCVSTLTFTFTWPVFVSKIKKFPKNTFHIFRQQGNLLQFKDTLHNLFYFTQNAVYYIHIFHESCAKI